MKFSTISDVHVTTPDGKAATLLMSFIDQSISLRVDSIYLLGDIFDLMIGPKQQYHEKYKTIFEQLKKASDLGIKLFYAQGNHDFQLSLFFAFLLKRHDLPITYSDKTFSLKENGVTIYLNHGDQLDEVDINYKRWKNIYTSKFFYFLVRYCVPYWFINYVGTRASKNSKIRNAENFNFQEASKLYVERSHRFLVEDNSVLVCGHTHIKHSGLVGKNKLYYNNGFPLSDNLFIYFDGKDFHHKSIILNDRD